MSRAAARWWRRASLTRSSRLRGEIDHGEVRGVVVVPQVAREVGQLAQRAQELDRSRLRLQRFNLVHDVLVHVGPVQQLRERALGVGVGKDQVGLDHLAVGQLHAGGLAVLGENALHFRAGADRHAGRLGGAAMDWVIDPMPPRTMP